MTTRFILAPVAVFLLVSTLVAAPLVALQEAIGLSFDALVLTQFSTAIGAAVTWALWRHRLPAPPVTTRDVVRPLLLGGGVVGVGLVCLWLFGRAFDAPWPPLDTGTLPLPLAVVAVLQLVGAAGEEVGWRGLVQPLLETRMRPIWAILITGLLFALGHIVVLVAAGPPVFALFVLQAVCISVLLGGFVQGLSRWRRTLIATVHHWLTNMGLLLLFSDGDTSTRYFVWGLGFSVVLATLTFVLRRRTLLTQPSSGS